MSILKFSFFLNYPQGVTTLKMKFSQNHTMKNIMTSYFHNGANNPTLYPLSKSIKIMFWCPYNARNHFRYGCRWGRNCL